MLKFTTSKKADKKIQEDMEIICREIVKKVPKVRSIMLTGGFARGEGAVRIKGGEVFPYNDYDVQVIADVRISKEDSDRISVDISKKLGYRGIINFYPFRKEEQKMINNFYVDLKCNTPNELNKLLPRIRNYELRNHSKILWGKDYRKLIPDYSIKDIPLSEGAKLLLDRMSQMIEYYSIERKHDKEFLNYIIQQAYAACCTSLLMLKKEYKIGYKKSMEIFKKNYKNDFLGLYKKIPDLSYKIEEFISWKINPQKLPNENIEDEWFIARDNIFEVSKHFFSRFLGKEIKNEDQLSEAILGMGKEFYSPYLKFILNKKIKGIERLSFILLPFVSFLLKYKYYKRIKKLNKQDWRIFFEKSPDLVIFSSLIYFFKAIDKNGINETLLNKGKKILNKVYKCDGKNWDELTIDYANAYIAFYMQKI